MIRTDHQKWAMSHHLCAIVLVGAYDTKPSSISLSRGKQFLCFPLFLIMVLLSVMLDDLVEIVVMPGGDIVGRTLAKDLRELQLDMRVPAGIEEEMFIMSRLLNHSRANMISFLPILMEIRILGNQLRDTGWLSVFSFSRDRVDEPTEGDGGEGAVECNTQGFLNGSVRVMMAAGL